jgi:hypothetical protein
MLDGQGGKSVRGFPRPSSAVKVSTQGRRLARISFTDGARGRFSLAVVALPDATSAAESVRGKTGFRRVDTEGEREVPEKRM